MADVTLDVKGLTCPLPVLKTKKAMRDVPKGGTLEVLATDPGSVADFEAFSAEASDEAVRLELVKLYEHFLKLQRVQPVH